MDLEADIRTSAEKLAGIVGRDESVQPTFTELGPVLVDGLADLLAQPSVSDPLVHLAIYLMRHNPRHLASQSRQHLDGDVRAAYLRLYKESLHNAMASRGMH